VALRPVTGELYFFTICGEVQAEREMMASLPRVVNLPSICLLTCVLVRYKHVMILDG
jgi:hypothetical protein